MVIVSHPMLIVMNLTGTQRRAAVDTSLSSRVFNSYSEGAPMCGLPPSRATELVRRVAAVRTSVSSASP